MRVSIVDGKIKSSRIQFSKLVSIVHILRGCTGKLSKLHGQLGEKYFDYFVFNIVDYGLPRSGAQRRALAQTIGNARGLDINSPLSAETHPQDLRFRRHQQHDDPNSARGLDNNFAFDRGCGSTTHHRLRPRRPRRTR
jgi:hypothetical protein